MSNAINLLARIDSLWRVVAFYGANYSDGDYNDDDDDDEDDDDYVWWCRGTFIP